MALSAIDFMKKESGGARSSKLEPFKNDILLLKENGYTQKQIQQFLTENGIEVSLTAINWFLKTRLPDASVHTVQKETKKGKTAVSGKTPSEKNNPVQQDAKRKTTFDWNVPSKEEIAKDLF